MNNTLLDISKKIEPYKADVLAAVDQAARELNIPFFVVGGTARDFIMQKGNLVEIPNRECDPSGSLRFIRQMRIALIDEETTARDIKMLNAVFSGATDELP